MLAPLFQRRPATTDPGSACALHYTSRALLHRLIALRRRCASLRSSLNGLDGSTASAQHSAGACICSAARVATLQQLHSKLRAADMGDAAVSTAVPSQLTTPRSGHGEHGAGEAQPESAAVQPATCTAGQAEKEEPAPAAPHAATQVNDAVPPTLAEHVQAFTSARRTEPLALARSCVMPCPTTCSSDDPDAATLPGSDLAPAQLVPPLNLAHAGSTSTGDPRPVSAASTTACHGESGPPVASVEVPQLPCGRHDPGLLRRRVLLQCLKRLDSAADHAMALITRLQRSVRGSGGGRTNAHSRAAMAAPMSSWSSLGIADGLSNAAVSSALASNATLWLQNLEAHVADISQPPHSGADRQPELGPPPGELIAANERAFAAQNGTALHMVSSTARLLSEQEQASRQPAQMQVLATRVQVPMRLGACCIKTFVLWVSTLACLV
jgi:hypothetical protein